MITIHLHNLIFNAAHGIYKEEAIIGNRFEVSMDITFENNSHIENIEDTVNYGNVYEIIRLQMQRPTGLLEVLAQQIIDAVYTVDARIKMIKISIYKCSAPIDKFEGKVGVTMEKIFG